MNTKSLIVKNLSASYGKSTVLKNVSLELCAGEFVCLCGPNGSGKSTLLSVLAGLQNQSLSFNAEILPMITTSLAPTGESQSQLLNTMPTEVVQSQFQIATLPRKTAAKHIAFLTQNETSTWDFTVRDIVLSGRYPYTDALGHYSKSDYDFAEKIIRDFHIEDLADKSIFQISGGEVQKARIARSFAQDTDFLLLDEPLSSLDIVYENALMKLLKEKAHEEGKGILISVHDVNMAIRYADKIMLLPNPDRLPAGEIARTVEDAMPTGENAMPTGENALYGTPSEIITTENLQRTYGAELAIHHTADGTMFVAVK